MKDLVPTHEEVQPDLDRFLEVITPRVGDPTYSVLRAHLLFEELLRDFIAKQFPHPEALEGARLTFAQVLALSKASATTLETSDWRWEAIADLNKIRNLLAHDLKSQNLAERVNRLTELVVRESGAPLPEPSATSARVPSSDQPRYTALDMALINLFGVMAVRLGFDARLRLIVDSKRGAELARGIGGSAL